MKKITNSLFKLLSYMDLLRMEMLFIKVNFIRCHGIKARGLVDLDLHLITKLLNDKEIIKQVTVGLTFPMLGFEINPFNISYFFKYSHSL